MSSKFPGTTRPRYAAKKMTPGRYICIGTHHKTGTLWMRKVWKAIAADQNIPFFQIVRAKRLADVPKEGPVIMVNWHSNFPQELMDDPAARFLHIIRDPRDILLSGMRYHLIAGLGNEKFLRIPREELGGVNYQTHLKNLPDDLSRLRFEMVNKHHDTMQEMLGWNYKHPNSIEINYEDLIEDQDCALFRKSLEKIAPEGLDIDRAVKTFWDLSLFGGLADPSKRVAKTAAHVTHGQPAQWVKHLPREIAEEYVTLYGKELKTLKYETSLKWVEACDSAAQMKLAS